MDELWYQNVTYEDAKDMVKESLANTVESFIASGYWLKYIRDSRSYEQDGYETLWTFAEKELGLQISEASRAMSMNDKYSVDGNSPVMLEKYKQYNKSQLQEMLTMTDEQIEQVRPGMRIKDIRELKNPVSDDMEVDRAEDDALKDNGADPAQNELEKWIEYFVYHKFRILHNVFTIGGLKDISVGMLRVTYAYELHEDSLPEKLLLFDDHSELVNEDTGEIVGKYENDTVNTVLRSEFEKLKEQRDIKMRPDVKGIMNNPYCGSCGAPLDEVKDNERCWKCGQSISWSWYLKNFCDVAREPDPVNTESEEESEATEDIIVDIEVTPEQEEPLNVEFDTEELLRTLDDDAGAVIDGEYREVGEAVQDAADGSDDIPAADVDLKKCITGWSRYPEYCSCCGHNGVQCCAQCEEGQSHNCNSRCGWVDEPYEPEGAHADLNEEADDMPAAGAGELYVPDELSRLKKLLDKKKKELGEFLAVEGVPETILYEKKTIVGALANMFCELKNMEEEETIEKEQPDLPNFKNNSERKAWLEDVEAWGLWYEDTNIEARYYKYDFPDGSRIIAVKYRYTCSPWLKDNPEWSQYKDGDYVKTRYHAIFSEEYRYPNTGEYSKYYTHDTTSVNFLVDFIKWIAKKEKEGKTDEQSDLNGTNHKRAGSQILC